jgi:hypothetical protein
MKWTKWKIFKVLWVTAGVCFMIWMWMSMQAKGVNKSVLQTNATVHVETNNNFILFTPARPYTTVIMFYPGALVDPVAYAPLCRNMADSGYKVFLVKMPWRLAKNGYNKPRDLNLFADSTKEYILAGHSQGAKMAAQFVYENPSLFDKLILIATTHPRDIDLSKLDIPVMKISGSRDGVAGMEDILNNKSKLPPATNYVVIEGANHAQFGYYGFQLGDNKATIGRAKQQQVTLDTILAFIKLR